MEKINCSHCGNVITADDFSDFWVNFSSELHEVCMKCSLKFLKKTQNLNKAELLKWLYSDCDPSELREWINTFGNFESAMSWRADGFSPSQAETWFEITEESATARHWDSLGFTPEIAHEWIAWECSPQLADELISSNEDLEDEAPPIEFKNFGFSIQEAFLLQAEGISLEEEVGPENCLQTWIPSGLAAKKIIALRGEILQQLESLEEKWQKNWIKKPTDAFGFWPSIPQTFKALDSLGLTINAENIMKFWGLQKNQILKIIDLGVANELAAMAIRCGVSTSKLNYVEKFVEDGFTHEFAIKSVSSGLLPKHRVVIEQLGWNFKDVYRMLQAEPEMHIDEALNWLDLGTAAAQSWIRHGFTPEAARKWQIENFTPAQARAWELSGVKSPSVAKRRKAAGISP